MYEQLFEQFINSASGEKRKANENVYQMQIAKHSDDLKHKLEQEARKLLSAYTGPHHRQLEINLKSKILYYLREFYQKCNTW